MVCVLRLVLVLISFVLSAGVVLADQKTNYVLSDSHLATQNKEFIFESKEAHRKGERPLFISTRTSKKIGDRLKVQRITDSIEDKNALTETMIYKKGKLVSYEWFQNQTGEKATAKIEKGKIFYTYQSKTDDEPSTSEEDYEEQIMINDEIGAFVATNLDLILKKKIIDFDLIVPFQKGSTGFEIKKVEETEIAYQGKPKKVVKLKMYPTNFFVSLFLSSFFMYVDQKTKRVLHFEGQMAPKKTVDGGLEDFRGYIENIF